MTHASQASHSRISGFLSSGRSGGAALARVVNTVFTRVRGSTLLAGAASVAWTVLVASYAIGYLRVAAGTQLRGMVMLDGLFLLIALVLPIGLIWLAAWLARTLREQREVAAVLIEATAPLVAELQATRRSLAAEGGGKNDAMEQAIGALIQNRQRSEADLLETLDRVTDGQKRLHATLSALLDTLVTEPPGPTMIEDGPVREEAPRRRDAQPTVEERTESPDEPMLPMMPGPDPVRPAWSDLVKALDFPRDDQDFDGFRALQAVLRYHPLAQMLQSAEDVLTLLSQEGVYMEDLTVETGDPGHWRRFMAGERGGSVSDVGGIVDEQALELTRSLIRSDPIFRDTALFFQRRFDRVIQDFAREAGDAEILDVANTRSGRAFMLLARINGAFD